VYISGHSAQQLDKAPRMLEQIATELAPALGWQPGVEQESTKKSGI